MVVDVLPYSRKLAIRLSVIRGTVHKAGASMHLEHPTMSVFVVYFTRSLRKRRELRMYG